MIAFQKHHPVPSLRMFMPKLVSAHVLQYDDLCYNRHITIQYVQYMLRQCNGIATPHGIRTRSSLNTTLDVHQVGCRNFSSENLSYIQASMRKKKTKNREWEKIRLLRLWSSKCTFLFYFFLLLRKCKTHGIFFLYKLASNIVRLYTVYVYV